MGIGSTVSFLSDSPPGPNGAPVRRLLKHRSAPLGAGPGVALCDYPRLKVFEEAR